ncbi:unnamed protein product [Meganyctiphanes norvegica]|uniref:Uncharacterized protein n=1 Tax=Meganyctiphanes norvegica TaxID=48144 RepID=A0AAV2RL65_MEGNR
MSVLVNRRSLTTHEAQEERRRPRNRTQTLGELLITRLLSCNKFSLLVMTLMTLLCKIKSVECAAYNMVTAVCPQPGDTGLPCTCNFNQPKRTLTVKCSFSFNQDVLVNGELMSPFVNHSLTSAYIRLENASSVHVMAPFMHDWYTVPSAALDIWRGGIVQLDSPPQPSNLEALKIYRTFVGVGIIESRVPKIPPKFLRDRSRAALRIKSCIVGTFMKGAIYNVAEMRYLVIEDSIVGTVEGPLASSGVLTLSKKTLHSWFGLLLSNITADAIDSNAFNLTHNSDMERAVLQNSLVKSVGTGAITVAGDIEVIIKENKFTKLQKKAFQVQVTGNVVFNDNVIEAWEPDALEGLVCHEHTMLEKNTVHVADPKETQGETAVSPFHSSCGKPQIFYVVNPALGYRSSGGASVVAKVLGVLALFLALMTGGLIYWVMTNHNPRRQFIIRGTMQRRLINDYKEEPEEIVVNMAQESETSIYKDDPAESS